MEAGVAELKVTEDTADDGHAESKKIRAGATRHEKRHPGAAKQDKVASVVAWADDDRSRCMAAADRNERVVYTG